MWKVVSVLQNRATLGKQGQVGDMTTILEEDSQLDHTTVLDLGTSKQCSPNGPLQKLTQSQRSLLMFPHISMVREPCQSSTLTQEDYEGLGRTPDQLLVPSPEQENKSSHGRKRQSTVRKDRKQSMLNSVNEFKADSPLKTQCNQFEVESPILKIMICDQQPSQP